MRNDWKLSLQIAFTYIGTVVGAGFASGREIIEFFVQYGEQGLIGILLSALLFVWAGVRVMIVAHRIQADSYQEISTFLFGKRLGHVFNLFLMLILLGTTSVMLAAAGSIFHGTFGIPAQMGIWFSMLMIFWVTIRGLHAIHSVNSLFVPILIGFTVLVFWHSAPWTYTAVSLFPQGRDEPMMWLRSAVSYVSLNVALTQAVLVPIGKESRSEKTLVRGGLLGGLGIGFLLLLAFFAIQTGMPDLQQVDMPMISLLADLGKGITILYGLLVYGEIFSTLIANVFGLVHQLRKVVPFPVPIMTGLILAISYFISFVGFGPLLSLLYPLFGQLVVFFLLMMCYRQLENRFFPKW